MTDQQWDGVERRAVDQRFEKAMADVRALKGGVSDLADAIQIRSDTIKAFVTRVGVMLAVLLIFQFFISLFLVNGLNTHMDEGHNRIVCHLNLTPEQKAALGELACK